MKSFKQKLSEVSKHNRSDENNRFKDMHSYETKSHPVAPDEVFTGNIKGKVGTTKTPDESKYDQQYITKNGSDAGGARKLGEEAEQTDESSCGSSKKKNEKVEKVKANELIKKALAGGSMKESRKAALAKSLDKATRATKAGKKAVTLKKAPWEKKESIDEAVRPGMFKFNDGKSTKVSPQDAKLLNSMFKGLNNKNRKEMETVMKKDMAGFEEIVGFAREAL